MSTSPSCSPAEVFLMLKVEQGGKKSFPFNMRCNVVKGCKSLFLEPWWNVSTLCLLLLPGSQKHFLESKTPDWSFNYLSITPSPSPDEVFLMLKVEQVVKKSFPFNMQCNVVKGCKSLFLEPWWNVSTLCLLLLPGSQKHFLESKTPDWSFNYLSITPSPSPDEVFLVLKVEQVVKKSFPFNMRCNVSTLHSMLKRVAKHYS